MRVATTMMAAVVSLFCIMTIACFPSSNTPTNPSWPPDGGPPPDGATSEEIEGAKSYPSCARACVNLRRFACPEGFQEPRGDTCFALCAKLALEGKFGLNAECVDHATTVTEIRLCKTVRCMH